MEKTLEARAALLTALRKEPLLKSMLHGHTRSVRSVSFSPDGNTLASVGMYGELILWDPHTYQDISQSLVKKGRSVDNVAFSPDGKILASGSYDKTIILWDPKTRKPLGPPLTGHEYIVPSLAFSPDGRILASGGRDIILWDLSTRKPLVPSLSGLYGYVAFSPDGHTLAAGDTERGHEIILFDLKTRKPLGSPLIEDLPLPSKLTFSPTGHILASISTKQGNVSLWNLKTRNTQELKTDNVESLAFSPDGSTVVTGGQGIIFWDLPMLRPLGSPPGGDKDAVNSVVFTPDGQTLASGNQDGSVRFYDGSLQSWIDRARQMANRNLTHGEWKKCLGDEPYHRTFANLPDGGKDN